MGGKKPERIEKELLLLRNLPNYYKLGKKVTALGTVIYLEIEKSAINTKKGEIKLGDSDRFNFDILLRDKFPFQPPLIMTKTNFCSPSLSDGRDLLGQILPADQNEWRPSMNLYELIQQIPEFIRETLLKQQKVQQKISSAKMVGRFHLGLNYDMLIWLQNSQCRVFPCQQELEVTVKVKDKTTGQMQKRVKKNMVDIYLVVTETVLLMLKTDTKIKNVAKLLAWASLPALEKIKHSLEANDQITLQWRPTAEGRKPWVVNVLMN